MVEKIPTSKCWKVQRQLMSIALRSWATSVGEGCFANLANKTKVYNKEPNVRRNKGSDMNMNIDTIKIRMLYNLAMAHFFLQKTRFWSVRIDDILQKLMEEILLRI